MIRASGVSRNFGGRTLFEQVDWFLGDRDRCGLVGPNGSGKSTWLKILAAEEQPDEGRIEMPKGQRLGYLPQTGYYRGTRGVWEEARDAFREVIALQGEKSLLEAKLHAEIAPAEAEGILHRIDALEEEFRRRGGYDIDRQVDLVLRGLGFQPSEFEKPTPLLSGGWQMRVALARILLERPDVLLLDEPTNFLDLEAREWLEGFLRDYPGGVLLVSHDRYFLDVTVTRVTDIMSRRLVDYTGNYSRFVEERERRYEEAEKAYERQQDEIRRVEVFINRFRAKNTKATQVQSRVKMLEKMEKLEKPPAPPKAIRFQFPQPDRTGRMVLELKDVKKSYGPLLVFQGVSLGLERGQKVALVGPNGAGKSTLMRILAGIEPFEQGERSEGHKATIDHFAQDAADQLPGDRTILSYAMERCPTHFVPRLRGLLGAFLFTGEDVDKKIGVLSGGERSRLALAMMLMVPSNVILLDEPTNHLDIAAQEVLLHALKEFEGTVVFVSHDRAFITGLATRVIEVGGGRILDHPGDYDSFLYKKGLLATPTPAEDGRPTAEPARPEADTQSRDRKKSAKRVRELEQAIATLEERKGKLEALLARDDLYRDAEKSSFYLGEYREVTRELESAIEAWAEAAEE